MKHKPGARSLWLLGAVVALVLAASAIFFAAGAVTRPARAASPRSSSSRRSSHHRRAVAVVLGQRLLICELGLALHLRRQRESALHVPGGTNRATVPNAYVVSSVESRIFVNGVEVPEFALTFTPPQTNRAPPWKGHWLMTVTCQGPPGGTSAVQRRRQPRGRSGRESRWSTT